MCVVHFTTYTYNLYMRMHVKRSRTIRWPRMHPTSDVLKLLIMFFFALHYLLTGTIKMLFFSMVRWVELSCPAIHDL